MRPPAAMAGQQVTRRNLVENPGFEALDPATGLPRAWLTGTPRQEVAPAFEVDSSVSHSGRSSARSAANGSPGTFGYWVTTVAGIQEGAGTEEFRMTDLTLRRTDFLSARSYRVACFFRTRNIESPSRNIWIRVNWLDAGGREVFTEFVSRFVKEGDWYRAEQVLTAPRPARSLRLELALQWTATGTVWWDDVAVEEVRHPAPRKIKVATAYSMPAGRSTPEKNRRFYAEKIIEAGRLGVDLLCLGEGITVVSTGKAYADVAEPVPGPTSRILGEAASKSRLCVVAGIYEREGPLLYNTALLIDREGNVTGKYRKTHLPQTEVNGGLTPGSTYPVFRTDFGTVGIEICYDNFFPEVARSLALQGAEIILLPIWGDMRGQGYAWDIVARARAIDNAVFLIASMYSNRRSLIINPDGRILADTGGDQGLVTAEIDLNARTFERWLSVGSYGEWKSLFPQERRSETYGGLMTQPEK
ncbi:MAG: carbon-nitrogen hydrolase family protein [Acidobacteria bacterium]|nr:carbon-nitrogen hydrolase family protein [Acidobacteriota bacterium]